MKRIHILLPICVALPLAVGAACSKSEGGDTKPAAAPAAAPAPAAAAAVAATAAPGATGTAAAAAGAVAVAAAADPAAEAKNIFSTRCVTCHGASGKGDGAAAAALNPKPRDYTDKKWQASVTDEQLAAAIVGGGVSVGKSALMPANPDLKGKDAVVGEIVKIIRSFAK
jgi:mono/diheme cytochrome c family protein